MKGEKSMQSMIIIIYYNNLCKVHTFFTPLPEKFLSFSLTQTLLKYFLQCFLLNVANPISERTKPIDKEYDKQSDKL